MGHHIDSQGRFQSDKHPGLAPDKVVIDLSEPETWAGLLLIAASYRARDGGFADDLADRVRQLSIDAGEEICEWCLEPVYNGESHGDGNCFECEDADSD